MEFARMTIEKPEIDLSRLRGYRLGRIRQQLEHFDMAFCVLVNPVSQRYAIDFREYQGFQSRLPASYVFVPVEGPVILHGSEDGPYELVDDYRPNLRLNSFDGGLDLADQARGFAEQTKAFLDEIGLAKDSRRVAIERLNPSVTQAMLQIGLEPCDGGAVMERAKSIKSAEEIQCMRYSIAVAEHGMQLMQETLEPGVRETELWSILHQVNIAHDGDWMDGRMLCSGPRTNPWLQEATERVIEAGEFVAFDTDMVGPFGYCADISRTWLCESNTPNEQQRDVYRRAYEEIHHNMDLAKPGMTFKELSDTGFRQPDEFIARRYPCVAHGIGMSDEYPKIYYPQDWHRGAYDGVIEADMALCFESFTGSEHGGEGVKLEQMALMTDTGCELLSNYPFEEALL